MDICEGRLYMVSVIKWPIKNLKHYTVYCSSLKMKGVASLLRSPTRRRMALRRADIDGMVEDERWEDELAERLGIAENDGDFSRISLILI